MKRKWYQSVLQDSILAFHINQVQAIKNMLPLFFKNSLSVLFIAIQLKKKEMSKANLYGLGFLVSALAIWMQQLSS